ncbi:tape measure protein [Devosia sp. 2618]|uniref:tape measure protein n=1 Tax=Devosia sp. 2618 TaxID=3156454 RepID=UPI00339263CA
MQGKFNSLSASAKGMESRMVGSFGTVGRAFGVLGIALTTTSIIAMTSAWTDLNSRVSNAAGGIERGNAVMGRLSEMARRTYSSLTQTAEGYLQNQQALSALGYSTQQQLDLVETLNNALVVGAVRGQRAQSVQDAWSKAMASGSLRGENLNTVIQSGGRLSKALADSMGVSVNELRKLGEQGKITTDVMFGVTSQMEILRDEAGRMPATATDGFGLLKDAVTAFVGKADKAVGSSQALAEALISISDAIKNAPDEAWFEKVFKGLGDELARTIKDGARELEYIAKIIDYISNKKTDTTLGDLVPALKSVNAAAIETDGSLDAAAQRLREFAEGSKGVFSPEVEAAFQDLIAQLLDSHGNAILAREAIQAMGDADPKFDIVVGEVQGLVSWFLQLRDAAKEAASAASLAAVAGRSSATNIADQRAEQLANRKRVDLSDDGRPVVPIKPTGSGSGSSSRSPTQRFQDDLDGYARKIEMLKQETALTAALNPLLNDYGFAKAQLTAQQELENAATKAGIELGPQQREKIAELAAGYATATAEAARLAETQGLLKKSADELAQAGRQMLDTIIDGFLEGKDAGEIFNSMLKDLGKNLLNIGLNLIGGGMQTGGFNFMKLFGFSKGGIAANGRPQPLRQFAKGGVSRTAAIFGEAGPEAAVPLPDGRRIPVDLRMPAIPQARGGEQKMAVHIVLDNELLTAVVRDEAGRVVATAAPTIVGASVNQANKSAPSALAKYQQQRGGGDYRT